MQLWFFVLAGIVHAGVQMVFTLVDINGVGVPEESTDPLAWPYQRLNDFTEPLVHDGGL